MIVSTFFYASALLSIEITSLLTIGLIALIFGLFPLSAGKMSVADIFAGFSNPALMAILFLMIIGEGLSRTGLLNSTAKILSKLAGGSAYGAILLSFVIVAITSGFLNNIPVVVIFIPILVDLARSATLPASKIMMGVSYASIFGGMTTLIGSSTNILVSSLLVGAGFAGFGFFDFTIPGLIMAAAGLFYIAFVLPLFMRESKNAAKPSHRTAAKPFFISLNVTPDIGFVGRPISDVLKTELVNFFVIAINRDGSVIRGPFFKEQFALGDKIAAIATHDDIAHHMEKFQDAFASFSDPKRKTSETLPTDLPYYGEASIAKQNPEDENVASEFVIAEVLIPPNSRLLGLTADQLHALKSNKFRVIGREWLHKKPERRVSLFQHSRLKAGDVLLLQGKRKDMEVITTDPDLIMLNRISVNPALARKAPLAAAIFACVIACSAFDILNIAVAGFLGAMAMVATRIISIERSFRTLDRKVIFVIASTLALGKALEATGGSELLASGLVGLTSDWTTPFTLAMFFILVAVSSNIVSTKVAAVLYTPIAISIAQALNAPVEPFAIAVIFGANCAFASPIGYQTNLLVMQTGQYRYGDFVRGGLPLLVIVCAVFTFLANYWFDLT